jgi:hypothetical protein
MRIPYSRVGRSDEEAMEVAPVAALTSNSFPRREAQTNGARSGLKNLAARRSQTVTQFNEIEIL